MHDHPHSHGPSAETPPAAPSRGVVVDIGPGVGALVLYADRDREGTEVEIFPGGVPEERQHVWVLPRELGVGGTVSAAVFPSLQEGKYMVCVDKGGEGVQEVEVVGARVTEARWL
jgi:hypothetical protein